MPRWRGPALQDPDYARRPAHLGKDAAACAFVIRDTILCFSMGSWLIRIYHFSRDIICIYGSRVAALTGADEISSYLPAMAFLYVSFFALLFFRKVFTSIRFIWYAAHFCHFRRYFF